MISLTLSFKIGGVMLNIYKNFIRTAAFLLVTGICYSQITISHTPTGRYQTGVYNGSASEIVQYDPVSKKIFSVNAASDRIDVISFSNPSSMTLSSYIDVSSVGSPNSIVICGNYVAVAIQNPTKTNNGFVSFIDIATNQVVKTLNVGILPDMVAKTPDGNFILTANEAEPNDDYSLDPIGSVSIVDISGGILNLSQTDVTTLDFSPFESKKDSLKAAGVRITGTSGTTLTKDIEPEYITVSADSKTAWVALQENNAFAILDIENKRFTEIRPLGTKDHNLAGNEFDGSDRDNTVNIKNWPVKSFYMPDAIASYTYNGQTYIISANEGDYREYGAYIDNGRFKNVVSSSFPNFNTLKSDTNLGRLNVSTVDGDNTQNVYTFGARSFSIWSSDVTRVFDSGSDFETKISQHTTQYFNSDSEINSFDTRSDNKGPEPEAVCIAEINGRNYAVIGIERQGGFMVYDVTDPKSVSFIDYVNYRNYSGDPLSGTAGDLGPEGIIFINKNNSPDGKNYIVVANEISGTISAFEVTAPDPVTPGIPVNVVTSISGTDLLIDWNAAADATTYDVYSSADPYGTFTFEANVTTNQYVIPYTDSKKFYYVVSKNATK
jgi:2',3'-cyclic-nucleotide 2'-phosphodiesterase / 3'-nucleotidase / 5'-nucleotidase